MNISVWFIPFLLVCIFSFIHTSRVTELTDRFLEFKKDAQWLVMFYAPWCAHCKRLEPVWAHVAQSLTSTNVRVGKADCTRFPSLATEFQIGGFPTIMFFKGHEEFTFSGDRNKEDILKFALRLSGPPVQTIQRPESLEDLKTTYQHFFVYAGPYHGKLWEIYSAIARRFQPHAFFFATHPSIAKLHVNTEFPTVYVYKEFKHYIFYGLKNHKLLEDENDLNATLTRWVNQERFTTFPKVTRGNIRQLSRTGKYLVLAVVEENKLEAIPPHMLEFRDMVESVIKNNREELHRNFQFGWIGSPELANSIAMQKLPLPALIVVNSTTSHHHLPEDDPSQLTPQAIHIFLNQVLSQSAPRDEEVEKVEPTVQSKDKKRKTYGGTSVGVKLYRAYFEALTAISDMWQGNPVLTTVLFGLPSGFLCLICYSIFCADIMDAYDDDEEEEEDTHEKRE